MTGLKTNNVLSPDELAIDESTAHTKHEKIEQKTARSVYAGLGWLDRLLALWILLAIIIGMVLGNFVPNIGPALDRGQFVDVSVPIGVTGSTSMK